MISFLFVWFASIRLSKVTSRYCWLFLLWLNTEKRSHKHPNDYLWLHGHTIRSRLGHFIEFETNNLSLKVNTFHIFYGWIKFAISCLKRFWNEWNESIFISVSRMRAVVVPAARTKIAVCCERLLEWKTKRQNSAVDIFIYNKIEAMKKLNAKWKKKSKSRMKFV